MALARVKVWNAGEVLTASDLNGEFNNIIDNLSIALGGDITDGSLTLPGLKFFNDSNTGLYRQGADQIALVAGGATAFTVTRAASPSTAFALFSRGISDSARFYPALAFGGADDGIAAIAAGTLDFIAGGRRVAQASTYANATNYLVFTPGQTGTPTVLETGGGDANVPLLLRAKGTGYVQASRFVFESFVATQSSVQAGRAYWNPPSSTLHIDAGTLIAQIPAIQDAQIGDLIVGRSVGGATAFQRMGVGPASSYLTTDASRVVGWGSLRTRLQFVDVVGIGGGSTSFLGAWVAATETTVYAQHLITEYATMRRLHVMVQQAPGANQDYKFTLRVNQASVFSTVTISGATDSRGSNLADSAAVKPGDIVTLQCTASATAAGSAFINAIVTLEVP